MCSRYWIATLNTQSWLFSPSVSSGFVNHEIGSTGTKIRKKVFGIILNFRLWSPIFPAGLELFHQQLLLWYFGISSLAWKSLAFSLLWACGDLPLKQSIFLFILSASSMYMCQNRPPLCSASSQNWQKNWAINHTSQKADELDLHPSSYEHIWTLGRSRLGKSGIRICCDLSHYPNNSIRPWNLKSEWNPCQRPPTHWLQQFSFCQTWICEYFDFRTHDKGEACQFLPPPLCQRAELAAVPGGRALSCSADLTSLCLVSAWKDHCVHGKGILKMKLVQSASQAIFIVRHPFRCPIMSATWQISPELSCFRWLSFNVLVRLVSATTINLPKPKGILIF